MLLIWAHVEEPVPCRVCWSPRGILGFRGAGQGLFHPIPHDVRLDGHPGHCYADVLDLQLRELGLFQILPQLSREATSSKDEFPCRVTDLLPKIPPAGMLSSYVLQEIESSSLGTQSFLTVCGVVMPSGSQCPLPSLFPLFFPLFSPSFS